MGPTPLPHKLSAHPATVGETYGQHCRFALGIATQLAAAAGAAAIHAVYPPAFETTASRRISALNDLVTSGHRGEKLTVVDSHADPQTAAA